MIAKAHISYIAVILALLLIMLGAWYKRDELAHRFATSPEPTIEIRTEIKEVEKIVYLNRPELSRKNLLPDSVRNDSSKEVTAIATIPEHKGDTTVISVIDTDTGATTIETRQERQSLFELSNLKAIGIRYYHTQEYELHGRYEFLRTGALHWEVHGSANSEGRALAGVGMEYRW